MVSFAFCTFGKVYRGRPIQYISNCDNLPWTQNQCPAHCKWSWVRDNSTWSTPLQDPFCCLSPIVKWSLWLWNWRGFLHLPPFYSSSLKYSLHCHLRKSRVINDWLSLGRHIPRLKYYDSCHQLLQKDHLPDMNYHVLQLFPLLSILEATHLSSRVKWLFPFGLAACFSDGAPSLYLTVALSSLLFQYFASRWPFLISQVYFSVLGQE